MIDLILLIVAAICFALAALGVAVPRLNLVALGLFCYILTLLI